MRSKRLIAFDVETCVPYGIRPEKALDPWYAGTRVFSYAICTMQGEASVTRMGDVVRSVGDMMKLPAQWIAHNCHFEMAMLYKHGIPIPAADRWEDTMMLAKFLHNLDHNISLDALSRRFAPKKRFLEWNSYWQAVEKARKIYGTYDRIPENIMRPYQIADVEATMMLFMALYPLIKKYEGLFRAYRNEIELIRATVIMESRGIKLHKAEARSLIDKLSVEKDDCVSRANALCGFPINLNSDKQVRELLFGRMKIQPLGKTDGGLPAVDKNTIEAIDEQYRDNKAVHEILDLILHQRAATKGIAIIKGYIELADKDDIIHPHINTNQAGTGRQSSTNPNLQNVAKELNIKTRYAIPARRCFTARKGYFLPLCDYANIEMRLAVQGTGSNRLIELVEQNFDFHDAMAKSFYGDRYTKCTDKQQKRALRSSAKNARFAMLYGAGIETVARTLGLSIEETREGYARDREIFPEFYQFMDRCTEHAKEYGWIETFFGRRLFVDTNKPYSATDYCIQGTAAEVLKRAQVRIVNLLQAMDCGIYLLLPVHDELIFEYPYSQIGKLKEFRNTVTGLMTSFDEITVKLSVEWKISTSTWDRAREIK